MTVAAATPATMPQDRERGPLDGGRDSSAISRAAVASATSAFESSVDDRAVTRMARVSESAASGSRCCAWRGSTSVCCP